MAQITFETPVLPTVKRGRPEMFNDEFRAALAGNPGEFAVLQTGVKGRSRVSALRKAYPAYEFVGVVTETGTRKNRKNEEVKDETLKIYVRLPKPAEAEPTETETPEPVAAVVETEPTEEVVNPLSPEEVAQADAEFEAAAPEAPKRQRPSRAKAKA